MSTFIFEPITSQAPVPASKPVPAAAPIVMTVEQRRAHLQEQMRARIDLLPQRDQLQESDLAQWIGFVSSTMPEQALWHITRAGGVGGSEIGGLVRNFMGHRADFMFSAHDWALDKLFRRFPTPQTADMRRGIENEAAHRNRFYADYVCDREGKAFERLAKAKGSLSWMRYSPDDVVVFRERVTIPMQGGAIEIEPGQIFLIDYKAPSSVVAEDAVSFQYMCQLNMGAILAQEQGIALSGTMLSQFDWANWRLKNDFIRVDPVLADLIKEAGNHYWQCVLNGEVPPYVLSQVKELDDEQIAQTQPIARKIAQLNALATAAKNESDTLRAVLVDKLGLADQRLAGQKVAFPNTLSISATVGIDADQVRADLADKPELLDKCVVTQANGKQKVSYDVDSMLKTLEQLQIDTAKFVIPQLDTQKTYQTLVECGKDPEAYVTESLRFTVNRKVSEAAKSWVAKHFAQPEPVVEGNSDQHSQSEAPEQAPGGRVMTPS
ncbi:hypothetical protein [Pusillimonas sp. T2]|uniref:hypothetical protein n=1 Tax=Pusillimonas sp. T2 TaxID=1548123 RepID=UPI001179D922|nr:hypothetical protein [Pusillimonas sp. T2]